MSHSTIRVLLIEDDQCCAEIVRHHLGEGVDATFALERAVCVAAGLKRLSEEGVDVVLLDLLLPDSEGLETLRRLIQHSPTVPVVVLTGLSDHDINVAAIRMGAQDYLAKDELTRPMLRRTLLHSVERSHIRQSLTRQESHLRMLLEQLPAVTWTTDCELRFNSSRGAGLKHIDLAPGEVVGLHLEEFLGTDDPISPSLLAHRQALAGQQTSFEMTWKNRLFQSRVEPLYQGDVIIGTIGVALDLTDFRRMTEEFQFAREIQQGLLPNPLSDSSGLEIGGCCLSTDATGGDFFDYLKFADGTIGVAVGDVSGHGLGSALIAAQTQAALRALVLTGVLMDIGAMLATCNRMLLMLYDKTSDHRLVSLCLAKIDQRSRTLTYANAGHPPGIVLNRSGELKAVLSSTEIPLGVLPRRIFPLGSAVDLADGDVVLIVSDGVLEAMSPVEDLFDMTRTIEVVRSQLDASAQEIATAVCRAALDYSQGFPQSDDITAVVTKV